MCTKSVSGVKKTKQKNNRIVWIDFIGINKVC